jgi:glycerophosphoryl diester phosphodiesterase
VDPDTQLAELLAAPRSDAEHALAHRYAPRIRFDRYEPFLPLAAGYTVFRHSDASPSFTAGREIPVSPGGLAIEYAIWWDWDIQHLYELEHVWVFADASGCVERVEASWHGGYHDMQVDGSPRLEGDHAVLYSEPGKHAFAPTPAWFRDRWRDMRRLPSRELAGVDGVLVARYFEGQIAKTPHNDRLVHTYLARHGFEPSWDFDRAFAFSLDALVPWPTLKAWIPARVNRWLDRLNQETPPDHVRFLRIGHRGARAYAPDNTLLGFRRAAELGADMVEMDVQCTADGQLAVVHDRRLTDAEGRVWTVAASTLDDLQRIDLGAGEHVPALEDALALCKEERIGAYIEIKDGAAVPGLVRCLARSEWAGACLIGSFQPEWLAETKALDPQLGTSVLFSSVDVDPVELARGIDAQYVHPCWERDSQPSALLTRDWIDRVHRAGLGIITWHEERPAEIAALRRLGIEGICSDAPDLLLPVT